ncbi:hypothetical protein JAAARDRAFT_204226 [Jaapia argillacea MUCL 33604]|uniref:Uncharacterized protein n=1 Tax=Jaapia argillacea MUCL 33604 TaxID=933084 RepID=A0A067QGR0_9AGAM|nr:hypothetical protein JAAARDRAFT_204226 [Jaapia argillacea MUCL 33604]
MATNSSSPSSSQHTWNHMSPRSFGMQVLSSVVHYLGVTVLTHCLSHRITIEQITSLHSLFQLSWARVSILLVFLDSWLFLFAAGVLVSSSPARSNPLVCSLGVDFCVTFYATSKFLIYCFLMERVYIVWSPLNPAKRFKTPVYLVCFAVLLGFIVIALIMVLGRVSYFREDGACMIGLTRHASITLLTYDLFVNIFLTSLFLWPLLRIRFSSITIRRVASRTSIAAVAALLTSAVNISLLITFHGVELGWVCLASCGTDVICNAVVLFWVTGGTCTNPSSNIHAHPRPPHEVSKPTPCSLIMEPVKYPATVTRKDSSLRSDRRHRPGLFPIENCPTHSQIEFIQPDIHLPQFRPSSSGVARYEPRSWKSPFRSMKRWFESPAMSSGEASIQLTARTLREERVEDSDAGLFREENFHPCDQGVVFHSSDDVVGSPVEFDLGRRADHGRWEGSNGIV